MTTEFFYSLRKSIRSLDDLRVIFPLGKADELNWLLTVGDATKLEDGSEDVTALVMTTKAMRFRYGTINVSPADRPWLERVVETSLGEAAKSQSDWCELW